MEDKTNPWVRANLYVYDEQTLELIAPERRPEYIEVVNELHFASAALQHANERYNQAINARIEFFRE